MPFRGSPLVAERTVELLRADERVDVTVVPSLSFLDLAWERLGIDRDRRGPAGRRRTFPPPRRRRAWAAARGPVLSKSVLSDIKLSIETDSTDEAPSVTVLHHSASTTRW